MKATYRLLVDLAILICVIHGWWFAALPITFFISWFCPYYIEIIAAGFAYDALFGLAPTAGIWGYAGTIISSAIFLVMMMAKRVVRK